MDSVIEEANLHSSGLEPKGQTADETSLAEINQGLPPLELGKKPLGFFEFWPSWVFYIPIGIYWVLLSVRYRSFGLPMAVNPNIDLGGMIGESKYEILEQAGEHARSFILPYILRKAPEFNLLQDCDEQLLAHVENDIQAAAKEGIELPFVVKPELGCRGSGVRVVNKAVELAEYLKRFPQDRAYLLQKLAPYQAEAGVFYEKMPNQEKGRVTSLTLKYRPTVIGDGKKSLQTLIAEHPRASVLRELYYEKNRTSLHSIPSKGDEVALAFAGSHCRGSIFRNGNEYISEALDNTIDKISQDFPELHYGRFDIKFKDIESLQKGEDLVIIEVNGVSSEKTHIWDSRTSLFSAFATLFEQYTTLFKMGRQMQKKGYQAPSAKRLITTWWRELQRTSTYPSTD